MVISSASHIIVILKHDYDKQSIQHHLLDLDHSFRRAHDLLSRNGTSANATGHTINT